MTRTIHPTVLNATLLLFLAGCTASTEPASLGTENEPGTGETPQSIMPNEPDSPPPVNETSTEIATLGAGCFWCIEAVLEQLDGVVDVTSGYMGGSVPDPTYEQVCSGTTGHAEVVQVTFRPDVISYEKVLESFWKLHDPTTPNRQGNDVGTQYRSAIFYHSEAQRKAAEASKKAIGEAGVYRNPIVTEIAAAGTYYEAENYHQDYYRLNKRQPYCQYVIAPKLDKLGLEK